jgi:hypothetical protein
MLPIAKIGTEAANTIPAYRGSDCDREMATANRTAPAKNSTIPTAAGRYGDAAGSGRTALTIARDHGDQLRAAWATLHIAWALAELGELERSGRLIGAATAFLQNAGFARSRSDLRCEKAVLDAMHRRLAADAVHTLVQRGRDTPLEEALEEAARGWTPADSRRRSFSTIEVLGPTG